MKVTVVVSALGLLSAVPAFAESPLVVVDTVGSIVGEVVRADPNSEGASYIYSLDSGGFALFTANARNHHNEYSASFYGSHDCSGPRLIEWSPAAPHQLALYVYRITADFPDQTLLIVRYPRDQLATSSNVHSYRDAAFGCMEETFQLTVVAPVYVEALRDFAPPFHFERNPTLFWDQFQTGDLTRWSNY